MSCCDCTTTLDVDYEEDSVWYGGLSAGGGWEGNWAPVNPTEMTQFCNCSINSSSVAAVPGFACHNPNVAWKWANWYHSQERRVYEDAHIASNTCLGGACGDSPTYQVVDKYIVNSNDIELGSWNSVTIFARYLCRRRQKWYTTMICGSGPMVDGPVAKRKFKFKKKILRDIWKKKLKQDHNCGGENGKPGCCVCGYPPHSFLMTYPFNERSQHENSVRSLMNMPAF